MLTIDVIEACKSNDRKAQVTLYRNYCDGMYAVASRFLKNAMEAEDAVQDAFIKVFSKLHQYKGDVTFGAWLKRIVINTNFAVDSTLTYAQDKAAKSETVLN